MTISKIVPLPQPVTVPLDEHFPPLAQFDRANEAEKEQMIEKAVRNMNADLKRNFVLFINETEYSRNKHIKQKELEVIAPWKRVVAKICAILLCASILFAYFGYRLWKHIAQIEAEPPFRQAELARKQLIDLGLSQKDIYVLLNNSHQGFYSPLCTAFSAEQYGCREKLANQNHKILPRIWTEGISGKFYLLVTSEKTATLSSCSKVEIASGEDPMLRNYPGTPSTILQVNQVRLTLAVPEMTLTLSNA